MAVRILVVDDDRAVRESLRRSLSFNGYSVALAQDGLEALDLIPLELERTTERLTNGPFVVHNEDLHLGRIVRMRTRSGRAS